ncbi:MAG: phosphatidylserine decarboxylase [Nocardioidaceae bacterium]
MPERTEIVRKLHDTVENEDGLGRLIEQSLRRAHERAEAGLNKELYDALPWPTDLDGYYDYLDEFARWIPRQSDNPAWKTSAPEERYAKEVSDRLAHFYWLVDQEVEAGGSSVAQDHDVFADWLTDFARAWGDFLDTDDSFGEEILRSFLEDAPEYHVEESMVDGRPNMPSGWHTFNQFFARELNVGLRPIAEPTDNRVVTSPADCSFKQCFEIDAESNIPATRLKETHVYGNIKELMEGSEYADAFAGGTFAHYMLPPSAYHRYHVPVAGKVEESFVVQGKVFMQVDLTDGQLQSKDTSQSGYEFTQTRGVVTIDTAASGQGDLGIVAVIPVGMSHVASVNLTASVGTQLAKGDECGYFQFGGSDIIVLFQKGVAEQVDTDTGFRLMGTPIARCTSRS